MKRAVLTSLKTDCRTNVCVKYGLHWSTVDDILSNAVKEALKEQDLSHVTGVFVDETQYGHGHSYITTFLDQNHKVIYICEGHGMDTLRLFRDHLVIQGGDPESIRFFSADMSSAYESGILSHFPNADLVWDRFHLTKAVNDAVNDIRKKLVRRDKFESLKLVKYTVLTRSGNLNPTQAERLRNIRLNNPEMATAFDMKEVFLDIIRLRDPKSMRRCLEAWIEWVESEGHDALKRKAGRFKEKMGRIMAWTRHPVSNSVSEGVNKNIQDIRRQAYGFMDTGSFFDMILLRQGDLTFRF